jgi:hypothetical protein
MPLFKNIRREGVAVWLSLKFSISLN